MKDTYRSVELSPALSLSTPARDGSFVRDFWFCFFPLAMRAVFLHAVPCLSSGQERHHNSPSILPAEGSRGICRAPLPPSLLLQRKQHLQL